MIKKFEDFVGNNVNEGKEEDSKKQENLKELFREITSMSESLKKNNFEDKRMIVISGNPTFREDNDTDGTEIEIVLKKLKDINGITYGIIDEIEDITSLYKTLCLEKNSIIVFTKKATDEILSNDEYVSMLKHAADEDTKIRTLNAPSKDSKDFYKSNEKGPEYYENKSRKIVTGMFPSEFVFNGFIILTMDKEPKELPNSLKSRSSIYVF